MNYDVPEAKPVSLLHPYALGNTVRSDLHFAYVHVLCRQ